MPKWDIDRDLRGLEPETLAGTRIERAMVDVSWFSSEHGRLMYGGGKVSPTFEELQNGYVLLWCVSIGFACTAKASFYDRTIRRAYLQARKAAQLGRLDRATTWGRQSFVPPKKAKASVKSHPKSTTPS
jgi:hypothetical protein